MKKFISTAVLIGFALSYLSPTIGNAIDTTTSGRILDNFKAQQEEILFDSSPIETVDAGNLLQQEYAINGLESLKTRLQAMQSAYQSKKDAVTEVRMTLEENLATLADSIKTTEDSIAKTTTDIAEKQQKIQHLRSD